MQQNTQITVDPGNELTFEVKDIMYLPGHKCPQCSAPAVTTEVAEWFRPFVDFFGSRLSNWIGNLGYVYFSCKGECGDKNNDHHVKSAMRVAKLGDAIIPVAFISDARKALNDFGRRADYLNSQRMAQAIAFLAAHADKDRIESTDFLTHILTALFTGAIGPEVAAQKIGVWANPYEPVPFALGTFAHRNQT